MRAHAADDQALKRDTAEARNNADGSASISSRRLMDESKDKLNDSDKSAVRGHAIGEGHTRRREGDRRRRDHPFPIEGDDLQSRPGQAIERAPLRGQCRGPAGAAGGPATRRAPGGASSSNGGAQSGKPDDVIDVEFEEKK